jgi:hypothetical protein
MTASTRIVALALAALSVLAASAVWAQSGGGYDAHVNVFDSGGGRADGGDYVLQSAAGQPAAGISGAGGYAVNAGIVNGLEASDSAPSATPSATVTASPSPGAYQQYLPHLAKDGLN